jgi:muramoyltetrapeptide carboxypeptidase
MTRRLRKPLIDINTRDVTSRKQGQIIGGNAKFIIETKPALENLPIIANADFGHTTPIFTFPIGGTAILHAKTTGNVSLVIETH